MGFPVVVLMFVSVVVPTWGENGVIQLLAGILEPSLQSNQTLLCPGECYNYFSAMLCEHVVDELACEMPYQRCCVDIGSVGTIVVTSLPLPNDTETVSDLELSETSITLPSIPPSLFPQTSTTTAQPPLNVVPCVGHCVLPPFHRYCGLIVQNAFCDNPNATCCSPAQNNHTGAVEATRSPPTLPPCPGDCVAPLFSVFLCEEVVPDTYCPSGGRCCVSNAPPPPPTTTTTTTTPAPTTPTIPPCFGRCIPIFLSGVCSRPSQLIVETTCDPGSICCTYPPPESAESERPPLPPAQRRPPPYGVLCPGTCIAPFLRFTCFGNNDIVTVFACVKEGEICCAPVAEVVPPPKRPAEYPGPIPIVGSTVQLHDIPVTTPITTFRPPPTSTSQRPNPYFCGIKGKERRDSPRVVGGADSLPGEWCWQAALINGQNQYVCGAALIGTHWVLTAAHCITNLVRRGQAIYVRVGDVNLASEFGNSGSQTLRVASSYVHHNHNPQTLDNDIALLKLQDAVRITESTCLVCLPAQGSSRQPGKRCTVTGYGYESEGGPIALRVREAELPIVRDQECIAKVNAVTEKQFILPLGTFCAGGERGNDACQGDGGGPLVCQTDGYYELTGIVSWGFGCGRDDVPGVYVKVSSFIGWINQIVSVNNP